MSQTDSPETTKRDARPDDAHQPDRWSRLWREWVKPFLMVLVVVCSLRSAVADWNDVPTGSMRPTILEGERIFVNKLAYDLRVPFTRLRLMEWGEPHRGDVVVLMSPADGKRLVKRVVGTPGDVLAMRNGRLFVDGEAAAYQIFENDDRNALGLDGEPRDLVVWESVDSVTHPVTWTPLRPHDRNFGPLEVPAGHYFVMGDNRDNSSDSRKFGFVERDAIVGRATTVVFSHDPGNLFEFRWDRFFLSLP